jgi:hypothetical protein
VVGVGVSEEDVADFAPVDAGFDESFVEGVHGTLVAQAGVDEHPAAIAAEEVDVDVIQLEGEGEADAQQFGEAFFYWHETASSAW